MTGTSHRPTGHPAVHRHQLGRDLRQLRQARSLRLEDGAARAGIAPSTLSRIENGQAPARTGYLTILLDMYCLDDPAHRARLLSTAQDGQGRAWWAGCSSLLPARTGSYLHCEAAADGIAIHAPHVIPDLAQTPGYAYATRLTNPALTDTDNKLVGAHQAARAAHLRPGRHLHLIIGEPALRRPVTLPQVMTAQYRHLLDLGAQSAAVVQITSTAAPVLSPPFTLLTCTDPATPPVTCYHGPATPPVTCYHGPAGHPHPPGRRHPRRLRRPHPGSAPARRIGHPHPRPRSARPARPAGLPDLHPVSRHTMTFDFLGERLAEPVRINDRLNADMAAITRDFAQGWQIESIPPGTEWAAIDRTSSGDYIRVIPARNLRALRFRLAQAELSHPADLWLPPAVSAAPDTGTRAPSAQELGSGRHARVVIVRP